MPRLTFTVCIKCQNPCLPQPDRLCGVCRCRAVRQRLSAHQRGATLSQILQLGSRSTLVADDPEREARICKYTERAAAGLPLFR